MWTWLGCRFYYIPNDDGEDDEDADGELRPALTIQGFVRWSIVQLLLCPDLEVGVLDLLLRAVELRDPETPVVAWPRGMEREAVGGVDPVAGEKWGRWWSVLLRADDEDEVEILRRRVAELERGVEEAARRRMKAEAERVRGEKRMEEARREEAARRRRSEERRRAEADERAQERLEAEMERLTREILENRVGVRCGACGGEEWCACEAEEGGGVGGEMVVVSKREGAWYGEERR